MPRTSEPTADRLLVNSAGTLHCGWEDENGDPADPGAVTVTITRADGTALVTDDATDGADTDPRTITLTPDQNDRLDLLTAEWTSDTLGNRTTAAAIAGGFLFTIGEARTELGDAAYDAQKIKKARAYAELELERGLEYALVPRFSVEILDGRAGEPLALADPFVRAIRFVTVITRGEADHTLTVDELALLTSSDDQVSGYSWPAGQRNIVIGYEHGLDEPPAGAKPAALALALDRLGGGTSGGIDPRAESVITDDGTIRLRAAAGEFAALGVNEWIEANRIPTVA